MMWSALAIPAITCVVLYFLFHHKLVWWEPFVCWGPSVLLIALFVFGAEGLQTSDTEWLTDKTVRVEYHEEYTREWEEWVPPQTDDKGNVTVPGHWETHTEFHPEHWDKVNSSGSNWRVTKAEYNRIKGEWKSSKEIYTDLHHPDQRHNFGDGRGDMFHIDWPRTHGTIQPIAWTQSYENRIQATDNSVFKFPKISPERQKQLFNLPLPDKNYNTPAILGDGGSEQFEANKELMRWNAKIGPRSENGYAKAGRLWILIFNGSKDVQDAIDQESYWQGGNKNELTLCIGVDKNYNVNWTYVISWTKNERLKIDIRDFPTIGEKLNLHKIVEYMGKESEKRF